MGSTYSIGVSGMDVSQRLLDLIGQNIANAGTDGYHRQVASLAERSTGQEIGTGVEITQVRRAIDQALENAITRSAYESGDVSSQLKTLNQVQANFTLGAGSVSDLLEKFFNAAESLASQPADLTQRRAFVAAAAALADGLNAQVNAVAQIGTELTSHIPKLVDQVNALANQIADLNGAIQRTTIQGGNANGLSDQRDQAIQQLAGLIDVRTVPQDHGVVNVLAGGVPLVVGTQALKLQATIDARNQAVVSVAGSNIALSVNGGELHAELENRNVTLPALQNSLNALAQEIVRQVDEIHATGVGLGGPLTNLSSQRAVNNVAATLSQAGLSFAPQAGTLSVSVTNLASGQRTLSQIAIDPATQSLNDVATALNGIANLQAVVNAQSGTLTLVAAAGYAFDFAGRLPTSPDAVALTGTATPQIAGTYTGSGNDAYTFRVVGSGTVGVTPNLILEARDSANNLLASWNIGQGYEPGSTLPAINGVNAGLSSGTVNNGDSFSTRVVADPDTAGLLSALGLNALFSGGPDGTLQVRADLVSNPESVSASRSGQPADGANVLRVASLRDRLLLSNGTSTFEQFYANLVGDVGGQVQNLDNQQTAQASLGQQLQAQRQSVSGVDPNEEFVKLLQYQRSFQFSARFLSVVNTTLDDLLKLV